MRPEHIRMVLVEPSLAANVGAAARAMKTMGLSEFHLVAPRQFPHPNATAMASGADDLLAAARVHETLDQALAGATLVLGLSARQRTLSCPVANPREAAAMVLGEAESRPVAVLFGRERVGLTNAELDRCHRLVHIPANPDYSSLNIAASVQVMAYELRMASLAGETVAQPRSQWPPATADDMERLYEHLERVLQRIDFLDPSNPRALMRRMRLFIGRARPDRNEMQILRGILAHVEKGLDGRLRREGS
ncbi:RNA methyltransferase [Aquisalimonas sp.]|uniref:RNA methyltransferase n=1 Tax=Aquisalimonas sp. TaxID=1872621 RepID=UPI0025C3E868|nr:RNA methyltransferase [Aquisalimonas sp.]